MTMTITIRASELDRIARRSSSARSRSRSQSIEIIGLSPKDFDRVILVGGSTRMPIAARLVEQLFGQSAHLKVNPDEVVALGAAIQAHALNRSKVAAKRKSGARSAREGAAAGSGGDSLLRRRRARIRIPCT